MKVKSKEQEVNYTILAVGMDRRKDLIGLYSSVRVGAKFWLSVLTNLKQCGVKDVRIAFIDGLKGFSEAIIPKTKVQLCVVHQMKSSMQDVHKRIIKQLLKTLKTQSKLL